MTLKRTPSWLKAMSVRKLAKYTLKQHQRGDFPERGEFIMLNFNPSSGTEIRNPHPALVVSDELLANTTNFIWIMPISHGNFGENRLHIPIVNAEIEGNVYTEQLMRVDYTAREWAKTGQKATPELLAKAVLFAKLILGK